MMFLLMVEQELPNVSLYPGGKGVTYTRNDGENTITSNFAKGAIGGDLRYRGSFCPWQTGSYNFSWKGGIGTLTFKLDFAINSEYKNISHGETTSAVSGKLDLRSDNLFMYYGKCYKLYAYRRATGGSVGDWHEFWVHDLGKGTSWKGDPQSVATTHADECHQNTLRYGQTCQAFADVYCNGNGSPYIGIKGNGSCICTSHKTDPFCAPPLSVGQYSVEQFRAPDEKTRVGSKSTVAATETFELAEPYQRYVISGSIDLPQISQYEFKFECDVPFKIEIGTQKAGNLSSSNFLTCPKDPQTTHTLAYSSTKVGETIAFKIHIDSLCPFAHTVVDMNKFMWKFTRKYTTWGLDAKWEVIPSGYFKPEIY